MEGDRVAFSQQERDRLKELHGVLSGTVKIELRQAYPLSDAAHAHRDLESRKTTGSTVLLP